MDLFLVLHKFLSSLMVSVDGEGGGGVDTSVLIEGRSVVIEFLLFVGAVAHF